MTFESSKEIVVETVQNSLMNAPVSHTGAFAGVTWAGVNGSVIGVIIGICLTLMLIANAGLDMYMKIRKLKRENREYREEDIKREGKQVA